MARMTGRVLSTSLLLVAATLCPQLARAETAPVDYFGGNQPDDRVEFRVANSRTTQQKTVVFTLLGLSIASAATGLYFHVDSQSIADELEAVGKHTGATWTAERDRRLESGERSRAIAIAGYSLSAGFVIATLVAAYVTRPGDRLVTTDDPGSAPVVPHPVTVAPIPSGVMARRQWQF